MQRCSMAFSLFLTSLEIILENLGKRYNQNWIFKGLNWSVASGQSLAILGNNGSGKSTLLQMILGSQTCSEGKVVFKNNHQEIPEDQVFNQCSIAAPYLDLYEELSFAENIEFAHRFFPYSFTAKEIIQLTKLESAKDRQLKFFSSGMKQRVKLALAILSSKPVVLLDEPCSNLDAEGMEWYNQMVKDYLQNKLIIVSSNSDPMEMGFCQQTIDIRTYKNNG